MLNIVRVYCMFRSLSFDYDLGEGRDKSKEHTHTFVGVVLAYVALVRAYSTALAINNLLLLWLVFSLIFLGRPLHSISQFDFAICCICARMRANCGRCASVCAV